MCRQATRTLPPEPGSARSARLFLREQFEAWDLVELLDDALLALSELVTNGLLHARTPLTVSASCENRTVEIAVYDGEAALPMVRPPRRDVLSDLDRAALVEAEHGTALDDRDPRLHVGPAGSVAGGRGLLLVDALAAEWGVSPQSDGKAVWVRAPPPPPGTTASAVPARRRRRPQRSPQGPEPCTASRRPPRRSLRAWRSRPRRDASWAASSRSS